MVAVQLGVVKLQRPRVVPVIWQALELHCEASGATPAHAASLMIANWQAAKTEGSRMSLERWLGEGHWLQQRESREQRRMMDASVGVYRPEMQSAQTLEEINAERWQWREPVMTEAEFALGAGWK